MKSVTELREDALRIKQDAAGITAGETVKQLEELQPLIEEAHKLAVINGQSSAVINTALDLTAQAQEALEENGYRVDSLTYARGEENPLLYSITWTY